MELKLFDWNNWSNADLLELIKNKHKEINRKVTVEDLGKKNKMPSRSYLYKRFNTYSWDKILKMAGLEFDNIQMYPKEWALDKLREYTSLLGRLPKKQDFKPNNWNPNPVYYSRHFGTLQNALYEAGLIKDKPLTQKERIEFSIQELREIAIKSNKCPTVEEYDNLRKNGYARRVLENKLGVNWNEICVKYIPQFELNVCRDISEDDIRRDIDYVVTKLGRSPSHKEYIEHSVKKYSLNAFYTAVGETYNKTLLKFGHTPLGTTTVVKSRNELLDDFVRLFKELGRVPYSREIDDSEYCSAYNTYSKYFDGLEDICSKAGIDFLKYYKGAGAGKIGYDKLGRLCKSIPELEISNFLIDNCIQTEKELPYSIILNNDRKFPRKVDWVLFIGDKEYYVEYFGMYDKNPRGRVGLRYSKKTKKKIKDIYKAGLIDRCIFIFPWDLKNKTLNEIFEPILDSINNQTNLKDAI